MNKDERPVMVTIRCITYNHERYIRQCLDGFVMQKTNYRYEIVIHDDASTDRTADIIREYVNKYPGLFIPIFEEENQYNNWDFVVEQINANIHGKYIALCEGDDYWIDPLKLQKQVDFLEKNPNTSMVYTSFKTVDESNKEIRRPRYDSYIKRSFSGNMLPELFYSNYILTLTTMIRREVLFSDLYRNSPQKYDYTIFLASSFMGDGYFIPEVTGCYRKCGGSAITSHYKEVEKDLYENYCYFVELFLNNGSVVRCNMIESIRIYRNMMVNIFYHNDYRTLILILKKNIFASALIPESFVFSLMKKLKWKTYGSIDR